MKINIENGKAHVYTPYNKDFVKAIKGIGGAKWSNGAWVVPENTVDVVREIMMDVYGETDLPAADKVNIRITFTDDVFAHNSAVTMFGKTIARASNRDSGAKVGEDVAFVKGAPKSAGSARNWGTEIPKDSVCVVSNIPKAMLERVLPENIEIEVLEQSVDRDALTEERERLLARIAEIDRLLTA